MTTMTMEPSEDSIDGMSNDDLNETEMDSSGPPSDVDDVNDIDAAKLDASHREILEKLKRQELEEREEIERELRDAQREALERARVHEELRAQEIRAQELGADLQAQDLRVHGEAKGDSLHGEGPRDSAQTEILTQRPPGLLAQHGLTTKHHHSGNGAHGHRDRSDRDRPDQRDHGSSNGGGGMGDRDRDRAEGGRQPPPPGPPGPPGLPGAPPVERRADGERRGSPPHHGYMSPPLPSFMDRFPRPSPPTPGSTNGDDGLGNSPAHHWTFEEQFKQGQGVPQSQLEKQIAQLYELSDDPKRKEFLDDLFSYMQKRGESQPYFLECTDLYAGRFYHQGTPVNRIPIMAKQTLDLYELFRLVVSKGGLVEVINKKLWREITKGLNLPSSITSAAFTLRTQYMKYLYPYECEKLKLSSPQELQSAIDGNRREGRRPSYGYDFSPMPALMPTTPPHLNGGMLNGRPHPDWPLSWKPSPGIPVSAHHLASAQKLHNAITQSDTKDNESSDGNDHWPGLENTCPVPVRTLSPRTANFFLASMRHQQNQQQHHQQQQQQQQHSRPQHNHSGDEENTMPPTPAHLRSMAERDARAMEAATRAMEQATKRMEQASKTASSISPVSGEKRPNSCTPPSSIIKSEEPPLKRPASEEERLMASTMAHVGMPSAHLKITSRNDGRSEFDNSLVVSMEVNGIMYQGVLFAQQQAGHQRRI